MEYWPATSHCAQFSTSCGCCNKLPQNEWLKRTEMSPPTVLEAKSQKSRYINRATLLSGNLWGGFFPCLFWVLEAASIALLEALSLQSLLLPSPTLLSSVSVSFPLLSLIKTLVIGLRTQQVNPGRSHLKIINFIISADPLYKWGHSHRFQGLSHIHIFWGLLVHPLHFLSGCCCFDDFIEGLWESWWFVIFLR